jgi:hypothetical protein
MSIPWRQIGSPTEHEWRAIIEQAGGPASLADRSAWQAAGEHGWLALAMLKAESSYGTHFNLNKRENLNPLNLRPPSGDGYMAYPTYAAAIRAWRERLTSPDYKNGIYDRTETLDELIHVYAPGSDSNNESEYVNTIERLFNQWGVTPKGVPVADLTYGLVPYPAVIASHLSADSPWVNSGAPDNAHVEGVFWHRMIGSWEGTNGWFHANKAATAYGVSVAATDGTGGKIYEWIARDSGLYGESSGPAVGPYGDGSKLIAKVGVSSVNRTTKAIEISGNADTPLDEPARNAIVNLTAYFADQRKLPWDQFPNIPGEDRSFVIWHNEITGMAYKTCPGTVVMNETPALIARVSGVLKRYQTQGQVVTPKPPTYAPSDLPEWWEETIEQSWPGDNSYKGKKYAVARRNYVAIGDTRRMSAPNGQADRSGPMLKKGEKVNGERVVDNEWILTVDGHYVSRRKLSPNIRIG